MVPKIKTADKNVKCVLPNIEYSSIIKLASIKVKLKKLQTLIELCS